MNKYFKRVLNIILLFIVLMQVSFVNATPNHEAIRAEAAYQENQTEDFFIEEEPAGETDAQNADALFEDSEINADEILGEIHLQSTDDFVNLSKTSPDSYQHALIVITRASGENFNLIGTEFAGFGSSEYPFMGMVTVTNGATNDIVIPIDHTFFNCLDQSAFIGSGLYLQAGADMTTPLFAEKIVNTQNKGIDEAAFISLKIDTMDKSDDDAASVFAFAGVIGTMAENTSINLSIDNRAGNLQLRSSDDLGLFCNTMLSNSRLTVDAFAGNANLTLLSDNGNVGGIVGSMASGAAVYIDAELTLTGTVQGTGNSVGGLIGKAENADVVLRNFVTINEKIIANSASCAGGYIGDATYAKNPFALDLSKIQMNTCEITGGNHAGGLFGALKYSGGGKFSISNIQITATHTGNSWQFGGIAGIYTANSLKAELSIEETDVVVNENGTVTSVGGLIGFVGDSGSNGAVAGATAAYINIKNVSTSVNGTATNNGGIIGELGSSGHFVNTSGVVKVSNTTGSMKGTSVGGIIGLSHSGVLRLTNKTDLSELKFIGPGAQYGQIIGSKGVGSDVDTLVYSLGLGSGDGQSLYGWRFERPVTELAISDIGNCGEVIRLDGVRLTESVRTGAYVSPTNNSSLTEVVSFYTDNHKVIPCMIGSSSVTVTSLRDFVVLSIMIQYGGTTPRGAFDKYGNTGTNLLNANITIDSSVGMIDLTDTGVIGLLRDNGSQVYSGTFDASGCTIKLAAGQVYGINAAAEKVGSGQLYNHSTIGLFGILNGKVNNTIIDGNINFGMVNGGLNVYCGSLAGQVQGANVDNVTVKTKTAYNTGATGSTIPKSYVGGFFGTTATNSKTITCMECSMQGELDNTCTAYDYFMGGFIGSIGYTADGTTTAVANAGIVVNLISCDVKNATIKAGESTVAAMGGLVGNVPTTKASTEIKINLDSVSIDNLQMSNSATDKSGGLFGYQWRGTTLTATDVTIKNSTLNTPADFGGLVYEAAGYWKVGNELGDTGISFGDNNFFVGKTSSTAPSALLVAIGHDTSSADYALYLEILKNGLSINPNAVTVTLSGGNYFDDLVGITKFGNGTNAVVSIGLTENGASEATKIDVTGNNTWKNSCNVNGSSTYKNGNTRYYYNVDYYRNPANTNKSSLELNSAVDSAGDLVCWSLYNDSASDIRTYFAKSIGGDITGTIDLSGVSYYPVVAHTDIKDAEITFDYIDMNSYEAGNKPFDDSDLQHYQMHTGLFIEIVNVITSSINDEIVFNVDSLTLKGSFGRYDATSGGVIICSRIVGGNATYKTIASFSNIELDGIKCSDTATPLLVNSIGSYTTVSFTTVNTTDSYTKNGVTEYAANSLVGAVGAANGQGINIDFSDIGLDARTAVSSVKEYGTYHTIFTKATFLDSFCYADENSGGSYNFESTSLNTTYGKEISNTNSGRNMKNQYCYFDTFGTENYVNDVNGPGTSSVAIENRFATGYLPYVGCCESYEGKTYYHELDINQKAYLIINGCGTYGHPYIIDSADQMLAIRDVLDGKGSGTVVCVNTVILKNKNDESDLHAATGDLSNDDTYMRVGSGWSQAVANGNHYKKADNAKEISNDDMIAYLRNAYYEINESFSLDMSVYNGIGGEGTKNAFCGVIVGKKLPNGEYPTITLTCPSGSNAKGTEVGGLIRYSQGSVIKNLNIVIDSVSLITPSEQRKPAFFGGAIGWIIGGDNIIDNVKVSTTGATSVFINGNYSWLTAIGGYVGYIGSNDCLMGGGVVFRNIKYDGLDKVSYKLDSSAATTTVNVAEETDGLHPETDRYYWNPYVGRVIEGYACAEASGCASMGTNTDKNYKIPKLDRNDTFKIKTDAYGSTATYKATCIPIVKSSITVDSAQDIWVLSSLINSGAAQKATNDMFKKTASAQTAYSEAYYYGRARTGTYDNVGTVAWSAEDRRDENNIWGGIGTLLPSANYLCEYTDNYEAANFLGIDSDYRQLTMLTGDYDLTSYGNGFRGIGLSYFYDNATSGTAYFAQKLRMIRLCNNSVVGNNNTVKYTRHIYEYAIETSMNFYNEENPFQVRQAGFFNVYNQFNYDGKVENLNIEMEITSNQIDGRTAAPTDINKPTVEKLRPAFGGLIGRTSYNYNNTLTLNNINVLEGSAITNGYYAGGIFGRMVSYMGTDTFGYVFSNSSVKGVELKNSVVSGGILGYAPKAATFVGCLSSDNTIIARDANITSYAGGIVGQVDHRFSANDVTVENLAIGTTGLSGTSSSIGGVVGYLAGNTAAYFDTVSISNVYAVSRGYIGGVTGSLNKAIPYNMNNIEVIGCKLATTTNDRYAGGLVGIANNGTLSAFNVLSRDNIIGYLIIPNTKAQTTLDTAEKALVGSDGKLDITLLDETNIGLRQKNATASYWLYSTLKADSTKLLTDSHAGIWVGNGNNKDIKIVAASRTGEYSAVKSIGRNQNANSYVIYADYTGTATGDDEGIAASYVNVSPNTDILLAYKPLTSDGAFIADGTEVGRKIIDETLEKSYMKGHFGADVTASRSLDTLVSDFDTNYSSYMSTYLTEETSALYSGTDIPILVLDMTSSTEINKIIKNYISVLTNLDQTSIEKFDSIEPVTYVYDGENWMISESQSLISVGGKQLRLNGGKYDNTKNQITVIDVKFKSPIADSEDEYHLYIPTLVKKVMDISFGVKIVNGATGYVSAYNGTNATLASYGEDFTAKLTYSYTWTADEWNNTIANGANLMWSFDKQVDLDNLSAFNMSDIRLTLVDMNTHGNGKSHFQSTGNIIDSSRLVLFDTFAGYSSVPICDLLDLKEVEGTEEEPGTLKRVSATDEGITVRRWDAAQMEYIYYAPKNEEEDPEDTVYYNVSLNGNYSGEEDVVAEETYYLVINCTDGQGMYNKLATLGTKKLNGEVPSRINISENATYVLGDFYNLSSLSLLTVAENETSTVMQPGDNDYIDVNMNTVIAVNSQELASYVNNRTVYYRYSIHMTDEESKPVNIEAVDIYPNFIKIGTHDIERVQNLDDAAEGYVMETIGSVTNITIKALGSRYIGQRVSASIRYMYDDGASLVAQFPIRTMEGDDSGIKFSATASMAYNYTSLGNSNMMASKNDEKIYYSEESSSAYINYDSYNITSVDGNTSQLGLNGRETKGEAMRIKTRALFDASKVSGLNRNDPTSEKYPYYLEGTLSLGKKTETNKPNPGIGKTYTSVDIQNFLADINISCDTAIVDTASAGLGIQPDGTYKFRIKLTAKQVEEILTEKILINIDYSVFTDGLENINKGQYANYKVNLSALLVNSSGKALSNEPADYIIYTNAKIYLGIIGVTDVDGN